MRTSAWLFSIAAILSSGVAAADPTLRVQFSQHGDFAWVGNTSAQECAGTARTPVVGTIGGCGASTGDTAPDVFWRADDPNAGQARARTQNSAAEARSTAILSLPPGATVTYARLYWGAELTTNTPDATVTVDRPAGNTTVFTTDVMADARFSVAKANTTNVFWYEGSADVTNLVKQRGAGAYRVSGINSVNLVDFNSEDPFVAWSLVVFYELTSDPQRNLALFDGLDLVSANSSAEVTISGFQVPNAGFDAKLGVMAFEGDIVFNGDALIFNGHTLSDAVNPANNFFNSSRSWLGAPVSVAGDLPQMDGLAASMSGFDLDVMDITPYVSAGQTSATVQATSAGDTYVLGAFATSISTFQPEFGTAVKSFVDLNGGSLVRGDTIEYTIIAPNTGNDTAVGVVLTDHLPAGVTYVPGSLQIITGPNSGAKTDAAADDQAEFTAGTITIRLGTGADATLGGSVAPGESSTVKFQVKVDADAVGTVSNQATISASGLKGNPRTDYPSGNGTPGTPTTFGIECQGNGDCAQPKPVCNTVAVPNVCVGCLVDMDCGAVDSGRICDVPSTTCVDGCRGLGGNGCPAGQICSSSTALAGVCQASAPDGGPEEGGTDAGASDAGASDAGANDGEANDAPSTPDANDSSLGSDGNGGDASASFDAEVGTDGNGDVTPQRDASLDGQGGGADAAPDGSAVDARADGTLGDGASGDGALADGALADSGESTDGGLPSDGSPGSDGPLADADDSGDAAGDGEIADADGSLPGLDSSPTSQGGSIEGGGCSCSLPGPSKGIPTQASVLLVGLAIASAARRRRRQTH